MHGRLHDRRANLVVDGRSRPDTLMARRRKRVTLDDVEGDHVIWNRPRDRVSRIPVSESASSRQPSIAHDGGRYEERHCHGGKCRSVGSAVDEHSPEVQNSDYG